MSTTILCGLSVVAFTFKNDQITWFWNEDKPVAFILGIIALGLSSQWIKHQKLLNKAK